MQSRGSMSLMDVVKRPFSDVSQVEPLVWPLVPEHSFPQSRHFTWENVDVNDSVPVCASTYDEIDKDDITVPYEAEIVCIETDGVAFDHLAVCAQSGALVSRILQYSTARKHLQGRPFFHVHLELG